MDLTSAVSGGIRSSAGIPVCHETSRCYVLCSLFFTFFMFFMFVGLCVSLIRSAALTPDHTGSFLSCDVMS